MEEQAKAQWLLILNPNAGSGRGRRDKNEITQILDQIGFEYELVCSEYPRHIVDLTTRAIEGGCRKLITAGGDGSLNEVVNGIFSQTACAPEEITVGMIPVGTGNDWIKTFGIPNDYRKAVNIICNGQTMRQDVGCIAYSDKVCYFANMAGFGFDASVANQTNTLKEKGRKGPILYFTALLTSFLSYKTIQMKIVADEMDLNEIIFSVSVGIGKFNGGGIMQAPQAIPDNGYFQVTIIRKIGVWEIFRNLGRLYSGKFVNDRRVSTFRTKLITISTEQLISGEADGENFRDKEFKIEILLKKLTIIYNPEKYLK